MLPVITSTVIIVSLFAIYEKCIVFTKRIFLPFIFKFPASFVGETASEADIVVLAVGGKNGQGETSTTGEGVDSASLELPGVQEKLMRSVYKVNPKIVIIHTDGRPLVSE